MRAAGGPVIPNFGQGSSCVTGDHTFCWDWVQAALERHALAGARAAHRADRDRRRDRVRDGVPARAPRAPLPAARAADRRRSRRSSTRSRAWRSFQLLVPFTGITWTTVEIALVAYTLVILFPNIVAGLRSAPAEVLEAARGHGPDAPADPVARRAAARRPGDHRRPARSPSSRPIAIATIAATLLPKGLGFPMLLALEDPTPFKTEIYSAGVLAVALALRCDFALVALRECSCRGSRRAS